MDAEEKVKKKRKKMYSILAPSFLGQKLVGETLIEEPSFLKGKSVTINMLNLTGDIKKQQIELKFFVDDVKENKGHTKIVQYNISNSFVKRIIRRGRNRIDNSFVIKDSQGTFIRIKPLILTAGKASKPVRTALLKKARQELIETVKKTAFENIIREIIDYKLQKAIKEKLLKIFPVKQVEIRHISLAPNAKKETSIHIPEKKAVEDESEEEQKFAEKIKKTQQSKEEKPQKDKKAKKELRNLKPEEKETISKEPEAKSGNPNKNTEDNS